MRLAHVVSFFVLLFFAGCAAFRPRPELPDQLPSGFPNHSVTEIAHFLGAGTDTLQAYQGRASLTVRSPEQSGQFTAEIRQRKGDSLFMSISPGLGIEAARILMTPDSFFVFDRLRNRLMFGPLESAAAYIPLPLAGDDLFRSMIGVPLPEAGAGWTVDADESSYVLRDRTGLRTMFVDPALWRVTRYEVRDTSGALEEERTYSDFDEFDGIVLPRRAVFRRPADDAVGTIFYRGLTLNPQALDFELRPSASARRMPIETSR